MNCKIKIAQLNCQSVNNKSIEIFNFINNEGIDILGLSETFEKNSTDSPIQFLVNFDTILCNRQYAAHGGVALLIKKNITYKIIKKFSDIEVEYIAIEIIAKNKKILLITAYSSPNSQTNYNFVDELSKKYKNIILIGDLNAKHTYWNCKNINKKGQIIEQMVEKNNLTIINNGKPTHKFGNILDLAIVSNSILHSTSNFKVNNKYKLSDHLPISFVLSDMSVEKSFNIVDWPKFKNKIEVNLPSNNTIPQTSTELIEKIACFNKLITDSLAENTKKISSSSSKIKLPPELIVKIKQKRKLQRSFSKNHNPQTKNDS